MKFEQIKIAGAGNTKNMFLDQWITYNGLHETACEEHSGHLLPNIDKAIELTLKAIDEGKEIVIAGDYDADGICGTTILVKGIDALDGIVQYMIPSRFDGYGLNTKMVNAMPSDCLLITVDNGIACVDAIAEAKKKGMTVIVTDHHAIPETLPDADAIVHPQLVTEDADYLFKEISGATVAYKFIQALWDAVDYRAKGLMEELQALAGITVISDVMPLQDENRTIFRKSVEYLASGKNANLNYLLDAQLVDLEHIDETTYGFSICPVINAVGRLTNAEYGVDFLLSETPEETLQRGGALIYLNEQRKALMAEQMQVAERCITDTGNVICVFPDKPLHEGLVGIMAGRICQKAKKPTFVFTPLANGNWKGSARSTKDIDIHHFLCWINEKDPSIFVGFGGHAGAAGLTIRDKDGFIDHLEDAFAASGVEAVQPIVEVGFQTSELGEDFVAEMRNFAPWGNGFHRPVIAVNLPLEGAKCYFGRGVATVTDNAVSVDLPLEPVLNIVRLSGYKMTWTNENMSAAEKAKNPDKAQAKAEFYRPQYNGEKPILRILAEVSPNYYAGRDSLRFDVINWWVIKK